MLHHRGGSRLRDEGPLPTDDAAGRIALNGGQRDARSPAPPASGPAWENDGPVEVVRNSQGDIDIQRFNLRSGAQRLNVTGKLAGRRAGNGRAVQQLQIGPSVRAVKPDAAVADGQLSLELSLGGTLQQPQGKGSLQLTS